MGHKINLGGYDQYFFFLMERNKEYQSVPKDLFQIYTYTHTYIQEWISYSE